MVFYHLENITNLHFSKFCKLIGQFSLQEVLKFSIIHRYFCEFNLDYEQTLEIEYRLSQFDVGQMDKIVQSYISQKQR